MKILMCPKLNRNGYKVNYSYNWKYVCQKYRFPIKLDKVYYYTHNL